MFLLQCEPEPHLAVPLEPSICAHKWRGGRTFLLAGDNSWLRNGHFDVFVSALHGDMCMDTGKHGNIRMTPVSDSVDHASTEVSDSVADSVKADSR